MHMQEKSCVFLFFITSCNIYTQAPADGSVELNTICPLGVLGLFLLRSLSAACELFP